MKTNIQRTKPQQKLLTNLKKIGVLSLLAGSMIAMMPVTALGNNHSPAPDLFDDFGIEQSTNEALPAKAVKGKNHKVNVHTDLLWSDSLTLNLFDDVIVTAVRDRLIDNVKGNTSWIGHVEGEQDSEVFLTVHGHTMAGTVKIGADLYEIETRGNTTHHITKVDTSQNPAHDGHDDAKAVENSAAGAEINPVAATAEISAGAATSGTVIDVMVVYTPKASLNSGGQAGIETKIANAVAQANQAYLKSNVGMQINLVHTKQINYVETGDMTTSLSALTDPYDGKMDDVHALRNQYAADQVVLITAESNYCGYAWVMSTPSSSFASSAFSVVHDSSRYACLSDYSLAHELGHNMGNQHDRADASTLGAFDYSYGYRLCESGGFRTIMSYSCSGGSRIGYFSNPNVKLTTGQATGTATENNALSMNNTKDIVAAFRSMPGTSTPAKPANLAATTLSQTEISVTWSDMSSNETGFRLERSTDGVNWIEVTVTTGNNVIDNGLKASTTYQYRVRAYNGNGSSSYSNIGSATTKAVVICTANTPALSLSPSTLYSQRGAALTYTINLTNQDSSGCSATTFKLTNSDGATLGSYSLRAASSTTATWSATAPNTDGTFTKSVTASATGHANVTKSAAVIVDGTVPTAPGSVAATVSAGRVALTWKASTDTGSGINHYDIKRNNVKIATVTTLNYTDMPGKGKYTYNVVAYDKAGNLKASSNKSVTVR